MVIEAITEGTFDVQRIGEHQRRLDDARSGLLGLVRRVTHVHAHVDQPYDRRA